MFVTLNKLFWAEKQQTHINREACFYLDLEGSLEAAGKKTTEGSDDGGEWGESNAVDLEGIESDRGLWTPEERVGLDRFIAELQINHLPNNGFIKKRP